MVKKLKLVTVFILSVSLMCFTCIFSACGKQELEIPTGISINDDYKLSWMAVKDARSYTIKVTPVEHAGESKEYTSRRPYYSLANLVEGKYVINLKALSGNDSYSDSDWSVSYEFEKDYESGCIYTLINNNAEYEVTKVGTATGEVILGDTYRKKPVTSIAAAAFKGSGRVEKIVIGENVTTIGNNAFHNCTKLTEIVIPESVTYIGADAFHNCNQLQTIDLPSGITSIEPYTFSYCRSLLAIELPDVVTIGENAFEHCDSITTVSIPDSVVSIDEKAFISCGNLVSVTLGANVQTISDSTFYACESLEEINFSDEDNLTEIGKEAFRRCTSLETITIPNGVSDIGDYCFYECGDLVTVDLPDSLMRVGVNCFGGSKLYTDAVENGQQYIYADDWLVAWTGPTEDQVDGFQLKPETLQDGVVGIADGVFAYAPITTIDLSETVRVIGKYAFCYNTNLYRVNTYENDATQKSDLKLIDEQAFVGCTQLNRMFLNVGLEKIGKYAFYGCENLVNNATAGVSIIPDTVTSIGTRAFRNTKLYDEQVGAVYAGDWVVDFNGNEVKDGMIIGAILAETLTGLEDLPVRGIADYSFYNDPILGGISLSSASSNSLRYIGKGAFSGCRMLSSVSIGRRLERIEDYTFYKCQSLFKVSLPPNLKSIGRSAFYGCETLEEIALSETQVSEIGPYAFFNCISVKTIDLGDSIQSIEQRAFYNCSSVEEIEIPDSVTYIGERAFYHCEDLKTVSFGKNVKTIDNYAFSGCTALTTLNIPDSVEKIGNYAFYKCSSITDLTLGNGVKGIGNYAFAYLSSLEELYLPRGVENIGRYAFIRCSELTSVTLNSTKISLDTFAFYGCTKATFYTNATELPANWHERWNISFQPVVWGCELSEDGAYVVSVTIGEDTFTNTETSSEISMPTRAGYEFVGWSTRANASGSEFTTAELLELESGTTVYAVWQPIS